MNTTLKPANARRGIELLNVVCPTCGTNAFTTRQGAYGRHAGRGVRLCPSIGSPVPRDRLLAALRGDIENAERAEARGFKSVSQSLVDMRAALAGMLG